MAELASHVVTVEFHMYLYHLLDSVPGYNLRKLPGKTHGAEGTQTEVLAVKITKRSGAVELHEGLSFPKRFNDVLHFYVFDDETPIFFPNYEYHMTSENGVKKRNCVLQTSWHNAESADAAAHRPPFNDRSNHVMFFNDLTVDLELTDITAVEWTCSGGLRANLTLVEPLTTVPPPTLDWALASAPSVQSERYVDLRPMCPPVVDQGDLGTCGVRALVSVLEFMTRHSLSSLFLYYHARAVVGTPTHYDSGVECDDLLLALERHGICSESTYPYDIEKFHLCPTAEATAEALRFRPSRSDFRLLTSVAEFKESLRREQPFYVDVNFSPYAYTKTVEHSGMFPPPRTPDELDKDACEHSVMFVGFDDDKQHFIVQNSWGRAFGADGFGYLPYFYLERGYFRNAYAFVGPVPAKLFAEA